MMTTTTLDGVGVVGHHQCWGGVVNNDNDTVTATTTTPGGPKSNERRWPPATQEQQEAVGINFVSPRQGHVGQMWRHLAVGPTCRRLCQPREAAAAGAGEVVAAEPMKKNDFDCCGMVWQTCGE
jgi:hypothetical protein